MNKETDEMTQLLKEIKVMLLGTKNILLDVAKKEEERLNKFVNEMEELGKLNAMMEQEKKDLNKNGN